MLEDMQTSNLGSKEIRYVPIYRDKMSVEHSKDGSGFDLCGLTQQYTLYVIEDENIIPMYNDLVYIDENYNLVLDPSNPEYLGEYQAILRINLFEYESVTPLDEHFLIFIDNCVPTIDVAPTIVTQEYFLGDSALSFTVDRFTFTPACSYDFTYTA